MHYIPKRKGTGSFRPAVFTDPAAGYHVRGLRGMVNWTKPLRTVLLLGNL